MYIVCLCFAIKIAKYSMSEINEIVKQINDKSNEGGNYPQLNRCNIFS